MWKCARTPVLAALLVLPPLAGSAWEGPDAPDGLRDVEITLRATGGILWRLKGGTEMFAELDLIIGDLYDANVMIGWRF